MSTIEEPRMETLPPLLAGARLDQPTFHDRYEAMPPETRAELVGGVVYMPSPMSSDHGFESRRVNGWLFYYQLHTPGVWGADGVTVKLPPWFEPQPDCVLRIPAELGGQSWVDATGYLTGAPELVIEVARSSKAFDLGAKKADYERAGVCEYVVVAINPNQVHWFIRRDGRFEVLPPGPDGVFRSQIFPGLWLDPQAFYAGKLKRLIEVLEKGLATTEHAGFRAQLAGEPS